MVAPRRVFPQGTAPADGTMEGMAELSEQMRRRIEEIFGDVLPATTSDERGDDDPRPGDAAGDEWLRANRPPHHDQD